MATIIPWSEAKPTDFLLFHHLPKTAGTAVSSGLESYYGPENYKWFHGPYGAPEEITKGTNLKAVGGHFHLSHSKYHSIDRPLIMVTMFREPVDRVISNYYYLRANDQHHLHSIAVENTLREIYEKGLGQKMQIENEIVRMVSNTAVAAKKLDSAKWMVDQYTFFGLQEQTQVMELLFKRLFKADFKIPILMARTKRPRTAEVDLEVLGLIREHNRQDLDLYDYVKAAYEDKLESEWM